MLATIACVQLDDRGNNLRVIFQFNWQLQADPNHPLPIWKRVPADVILNKQMAPKVVTLHKIYDPYVSKNLKREPAIVAKLNHPNIASLEGRGRLCWQLLLMPGRRRERIERFKLQGEMSRWLFNFHHHFYDDECNGEMSMNMIVRMKVFQLKCKKEN